ncbi:MAG: glutamate-1-semialdehyde 2,1-aminomutase [Cocleimonas sp.]
MKNSKTLFNRAQNTIPGGVNSPVRAYSSVGGIPPFIDRAKGAYLFDVEGNRYIDYVGSYGPMIAGHANAEVVDAVKQAAEKGLSYGAPTEIEVRMAEKICELMPSIEMVRMVNSGTEATMSAIRLARGFTGRDNIVKFEGCYHGHGDSLLVKSGSGMLTFGEPSSLGVPADLAKHTITLDYNNSQQVRDLFSKIGNEISCVIVEPVAGNMNCIPPVDGFLSTLREVCDDSGAILIFDEVMTGFRTALGGAQSIYNIKPDLTTLGKIMGGGMPVAAFGGRKDIMQKLSPLGAVYQAGTLSGNPLGMAAGLKMLEIISRTGFYEDLSMKTEMLVSGILKEAEINNVPMTSNQVGAMFGLFFSEEEKIENFEQVSSCDGDSFNQFFKGMLNSGINIAPSAYETGFLSSAHSNEDIETTIKAAGLAFATL